MLVLKGPTGLRCPFVSDYLGLKLPTVEDNKYNSTTITRIMNSRLLYLMILMKEATEIIDMKLYTVGLRSGIRGEYWVIFNL